MSSLEPHQLSPREIQVYGALVLIEEFDSAAVQSMREQKNKSLDAFYSQETKKAFMKGVEQGFSFWLDPVNNFKKLRQEWDAAKNPHPFKRHTVRSKTREISLSQLEMGLKDFFADHANIDRYLARYQSPEAISLISPFLPGKHI